MQGISKGMKPPSTQSMKKYDVNIPDNVEAIWSPRYDFTTYAAAGQTSLTFFQNPVGQAGKTLADTNTESAGALPAPKQFLVTGIQVAFFPGVNPSTYGAGAPNNFWNDMYSVFQSGYLDFFIGSKSYLQDAPVGKFTNSFRLAGESAIADASTAAANQNAQIGYAAFAGPRYEITPIRLVSNQNFSVSLVWPTAVALPSTVNGRIGVILDGFLYRLSQ